MTLSDLKREVLTLKDRLNQEIGSRNTLLTRLALCEDKVKKAEQEADQLIKASLFIQTLSDQTRQDVIEKISTIVTDALQKVKDPTLEFKMLLTTERNQFDIKFVVLDKNTEQQYDILTSCGGTIADLVTFPLRVCLLIKWSPALARILILDETFKFVSLADQPAAGRFIRELSEKLNLQIILVTHSAELAAHAHRRLFVKKQKGESVVSEAELE